MFLYYFLFRLIDLIINTRHHIPLIASWNKGFQIFEESQAQLKISCSLRPPLICCVIWSHLIEYQNIFEWPSAYDLLRTEVVHDLLWYITTIKCNIRISWNHLSIPLIVIAIKWLQFEIQDLVIVKVYMMLIATFNCALIIVFKLLQALWFSIKYLAGPKVPALDIFYMYLIK